MGDAFPGTAAGPVPGEVEPGDALELLRGTLVLEGDMTIEWSAGSLAAPPVRDLDRFGAAEVVLEGGRVLSKALCLGS